MRAAYLPPSTDRCATRPLLQAYYPALDGLRAVAILLVSTWHYCRFVSDGAIWLWGWVGVDIFFVLSGFLITGILVHSRDKTRYYRDFYIRRSLRIFPLYYAVWLGIVIASPFLHVSWNRYVLLTAFYVGNLFKVGAPNKHPDPGILEYHLHRSQTRVLLIDHFWSLGVEEQFYLVWPLVVRLVRNDRRLFKLCCGIAIAVTAGRMLYRHLHPNEPTMPFLYFHTLSRVDGLVLGAALFLFLYHYQPSLEMGKRLAWAAMLLSLLAITLLRVLPAGTRFMPAEDPWMVTLGIFFINTASVGLILRAIDPQSWTFRLLNRQPLLYLGRISYGLYVFNELVSQDLARELLPYLRGPLERMAFPVICFLVITVLATLSFYLIESPFLRLKSRFAPKPGGVDDPTAFRALKTPIVETSATSA